MSAIRLSDEVAADIRRHATAAYPDECCGALLGRANGGAVVEITGTLPLANVTDEGPRRRFRVSPDDYRQSEAIADAAGVDLVGFYHSHPDHPAQPSQYDLDHAWPFFSYIIVAVREGVSEDMTSWRLREDRTAFDPEELRSA